MFLTNKRHTKLHNHKLNNILVHSSYIPYSWLANSRLQWPLSLIQFILEGRGTCSFALTVLCMHLQHTHLLNWNCALVFPSAPPGSCGTSEAPQVGFPHTNYPWSHTAEAAQPHAIGAPSTLQWMKMNSSTEVDDFGCHSWKLICTVGIPQDSAAGSQQ